MRASRFRDDACRSTSGGRVGTRERAGGIRAKIAAGAVLLWAATASADARTEARAHFRKGMGLVASAHYEEAISELQRAYEILPHPSVLYNIGRACLELGDLEAAIANFRKYMESDPADRDETARLVENLESRLKRAQAAIAAQPQPTPLGQGAGVVPDPTKGPVVQPTGPTQRAKPAEGAAAAAGDPEVHDAVRIERGKGEDVFEETVVTASRAAQSPLDAPSSTSIITEQDIRLSGIVKIPELLRRLAGVDILESTGAQTEVSLRGFNQRLSNKILVLVDGRSVYIDNLGSTIWSALSVGVEDIERIEVVRGPGSALYGADAFNGVVNIITKAPGEGPSGASVAYGDRNTTHGSFWATGREGQFAWRFGAGYDYVARWSRDVSPARVDVTLPSGSETTSQRTVRLDFRGVRRLGKTVSVALGGSLVKGDTELLGIGPVSDVVLRDLTVTDLTAKLDSEHIKLRTFWNHYESPDQRNNVAYVGQLALQASPRVDVADAELQYVSKLTLGPSVANDLHIGVSYRFKSVEWEFLDRTRTEHHEAAFLHDEIKLGRFLALVADLRLDYVPFLERVIPSPRGSILVHPSARSTVRGVVATAFRKPTFLESYLHLDIPLPVSAVGAFAGSFAGRDESSHVREERVLTFELGYSNLESDLVSFDSAAFYNRVDGIIELEPNRPLTLGDIARGFDAFDAPSNRYAAFFTGFNNACQGFDVAGGELGLRFFPTEGLDIYGNYTLNVVRQDNSKCGASELALLQQDARTSTHKVNVGVQVRTKAGIDGSIDFHYVSPQTWAEQVINAERQRLEYSALKLSPYSLLNARVGYRFSGDHAEVSAMAYNAIGTPHREHPFGQVIDRRTMLMFTYKL